MSKTHCKYGHEIAIVGRTKTGNCRGCDAPVKLGIRPRRFNKGNFIIKPICLNGHDTRITGRGKGTKECNSCQKNRIWKSVGTINPNGTPFTTVDFDREYQIQQGRCKMCGIHQSELSRTLCVDHDHKTGLFRGLLCRDCNRILGIYEKVSLKASLYLGGK